MLINYSRVMYMNWRKLLVWAVVFFVNNPTHLLASLSLLLALTEKSQFNVLFHFPVFSWFPGSFFHEWKSWIWKALLHYWLIEILLIDVLTKKHQCWIILYQGEWNEGTRKRCLRHLRFTVSCPNRNISFYALIGKDIVANAGSTVVMVLCWFKISVIQ